MTTLGQFCKPPSLELEFLQELDYCDGPILFTAKSPRDGIYVCVFLETKDESTSFLCFSPYDMEALMAGRQDLRSSVLQSRPWFLLKTAPVRYLHHHHKLPLPPMNTSLPDRPAHKGYPGTVKRKDQPRVAISFDRISLESATSNGKDSFRYKELAVKNPVTGEESTLLMPILLLMLSLFLCGCAHVPVDPDSALTDIAWFQKIPRG